MTNVPNFLNLSMSRHPCSPHPISSSISTNHNHEDTDDTSHSLSAIDSLLSVNTDTILIATAAAAVADQLMISDIIILC